MDIREKNILIIGLGISGVSSAKALVKLGAHVIINDSKTEEVLVDTIGLLEGLDIDYELGKSMVDLRNIDLIIKSPGVPLDIPILKKADEFGIEVITDIELAYRISRNTFIAITGTNGKTTTTTLTGDILKQWGKKIHITGNIGVGILWETINAGDEDIFVIETSSFQLESTRYFKPKISVIINITPDHIKWHHSYENYIKAKAKVLLNQEEDDYTILNYDDPIVREMSQNAKSKVIFFSQRSKLEKGIYLKNDTILINDGKKSYPIIDINQIKIPGKHNLENAMAAIAVAWIMDVPNEIIVKTLKSFEGIEHRLEFVAKINDIKFYNDSKGTNPNASIKAVEAIEKPIILIAGGLDKGNDFNDFIDSFNHKVKALIVLGETALKIKETAINKGFSNIYIVGNMFEAVQKSYTIGKAGDHVLLSPACASWDMYSSYEERGNDFKWTVEKLRRL